MAYIFLDESGDLGFDLSKPKTSRFFVITGLLVKNKRPIEKIIRVTHKELRKKYKMRDNVLHAFHEEQSTCIRVCRKLSTKESSIVVLYFDKKSIPSQFQKNKHKLYTHVAGMLLDRILLQKLVDVDDPIELIASKRETNKFFNQTFQKNLEKRAAIFRRVVSVKIKTPSEEKVLQAVDFISWALFRKYEYVDDTYYTILQSRIVEEYRLVR